MAFGRFSKFSSSDIRARAEMAELDARLNAYRPDLADVRLRGTVEAKRFVAGEPMQITVPVADMRREPRPDSAVDTQVLSGETVDVFEEREGWCWAQAHADRYVGYVADTALTRRISDATHVVTASRTFLYPGPDMKLPIESSLSIGSHLDIVGEVATRGTQYLQLASGAAVIASHVAPIGARGNDPVAVAEQLLGTPYLWGGRSGHGIDCSGLVQLAFAMCGIKLQRDTIMLERTAGRAIFPEKGDGYLQRNDLVFWKGHVAMICDQKTIIHASGHAMAVVHEQYTEAMGRIGYLYGNPVAFRRVL
jgi:cell wall-associated NlpC family hydrolase